MRIKRIKKQPRDFANAAGRSAFAGCASFFALLIAFHFAIAADPQAGNSAKGFKAPLDYFPPPHELQVQSFLEGAESEMINGMIVIRVARLQTFHEDGTREMVVNAPQCFYDYNKHVVNSTGALQVQTWDDQHKRALRLQGENGFYWQQTNSILIISNKQSTIISGPLTNSFIP
jgi:hypothetical protein